MVHRIYRRPGPRLSISCSRVRRRHRAADRIRQGYQVRTVLRGGRGVGSNDGLVRDERRATDQSNMHSAQLGDLVAEAVGRPLASAVFQRRVDVATLVAREERDLEPDLLALVTCISVLAHFRAMDPAVIAKKRGQRRTVIRVDRDVDVGMIAGYAARVEIDGPAAKEPIGHVVAPQQRVKLRQRGEMVRNVERFGHSSGRMRVI
jgi:hypothetical protein